MQAPWDTLQKDGWFFYEWECAILHFQAIHPPTYFLPFSNLPINYYIWKKAPSLEARQ